MVHLLVVEDDETIRRSLTRGLADQGATVSVVGSAVDAIKALSTDRPDAVMLDLARGPRGASRERQVVVGGLVGWATS